MNKCQSSFLDQVTISIRICRAAAGIEAAENDQKGTAWLAKFNSKPRRVEMVTKRSANRVPLSASNILLRGVGSTGQRRYAHVGPDSIRGMGFRTERQEQ